MNSIKCIFITFSAALLLLNSITNHYILLADENNPEVSKGFEFSIYKKGFHDLNASNEWAGCADALKELSNEVPLLTITSGDIQEYNWDAQVIILTKDATRKLRFALSHTDLISEHDIALQHLEKQVYESKGIEYDPDFHIGAYLYGDYNLFTVKQNRRFVYGGVFQSSWSNLRFDFPVARCHIIHNQLYLILLTNDTPFSQLDPRDEMGNFREIHLDSHGTIVLGIDDGTEPYKLFKKSFTEKEIPLSKMLRQLIRDEEIKSYFFKSGQLKDESLTGTTKLMKAAFNGDRIVVKLALKNENDIINQQDNYGRTPLIYAAMNGHYGIVDLLLQQHADYRVRDSKNMNALDYAQNAHHKDVHELILKKYREENQHIDRFIDAAAKGDETYILDQIRSGMDINQRNLSEQSALHQAVEANQQNIIEVLLSYGADINAKNKQQKTPLIIAAEMGLSKLVTYLLHHNADPSVEDTSGHTALIKSALNGHDECVKILLPYRTNPNQSVFMIAAENGHKKIVEYCLSEGIDPNIRHDSAGTADRKNIYSGISVRYGGDRYQWTALMYASKNGHYDIAELLINHGANVNSAAKSSPNWYRGVTPLLVATQNNRINIVKLLVKNGANINYSESGGYTALGNAINVATKTGDFAIANFLISNGANMDGEFVSSAGFGKYDIVKYFISKGVDLNAKNYNSNTALLEIVNIGIADITFPTKEHAKVAELLLSKGADLYIKNWQGETALDIARENAEACKEVLPVFERYNKRRLREIFGIGRKKVNK